MAEPTTTEFTLGQRVTFTHTLGRANGRCDDPRTYGDHPNHLIRRYRHKARVWVDSATTPPTEGVIVGKRTLSDGHIESDYESGTDYYPDSYFTAWLVAFNLRAKPVLVREPRRVP